MAAPNRRCSRSRYVWEVKTIGGNAATVEAAVQRGLSRLRAGKSGDLSERDVEVWVNDVSGVSVNTVAGVVGVSVLVNIDLFGPRDSYQDSLAAVLSSGFDEVILWTR